MQEWIAENDIEVLPWVSEVRILILLQTFGSILKKIIIKISGQGMQKICRDVYKKRKLRYTTDGLLALWSEVLQKTYRNGNLSFTVEDDLRKKHNKYVVPIARLDLQLYIQILLVE